MSLRDRSARVVVLMVLSVAALEVSEKSEAVLTGTPRRGELRSLRVRVEPPLDPTGNPWLVTLLGATVSLSRPVSAAGVAEFEGLLAVPYRIDVGRTESESWHSETVNLRNVSSVDIAIPLTRVTGRVLLGDEPLVRATLSFVDRGRVVKVRSRATGAFSVDLPIGTGDAVWERVEIQAENPTIRAAVDDLRIEDGKTTIRIPNRMVVGEVRDAEGRPALATVSVHTSSGPFQVECEDGSFRIQGLPAGPISFEAFSPDGMTERPVELVLPEDEGSSTPVRLILQPSGPG